MIATHDRSKRREFYGEASGIRLVHWLNGPGETPWASWKREFSQHIGPISGTSSSDSESRDQIAHLLRKLKQFTKLATEMYSDQDDSDDSKGTRDWPLFSRLNDSINNGFAKYPAYPQITINLVKDKLGRFKPFLRDRGPYFWGSSPASNAPIQGIVAVKCIQDAERQGWLNQIRECTVCGRWFFARRRGTRTCLAKCRKKEYQSTEKYKQWRRDHYLQYEKVRRIKRKTPLNPRRGT